MRSSLTAGALVLSLSLTSACAMIPVNSIGRDRAPRVQAAVILALAAVETAIAIEAAKAARSGETVCHMKPDAGVGFYEVKNDCDGPLENTIGAVMFGIPATIDIGAAIYQLITNKQAYHPPGSPKRRHVAPPAVPAIGLTSDGARLQRAEPVSDESSDVELAPPSETPVGYTDHQACVRDRTEQQRRALTVTDLSERTRLLMALPDCSAVPAR